MQIKATHHYVKSITGRSVTGIFAVHGNVDEGDDRSWPGSFAKTFTERYEKVRFLWGHDFNSPPIAKITSLREVTREELPPGVLEKAPEALGGAEVTREYLETPRGDEVLKGIEVGAINEMSYAYDAVKYDFEEKPDAKYDWERIRNLRELRLYEVSDVLWGMNPATQGSKTALASHLQWVADFLAGLKAGARHSGNDIELINQIASNALGLGATNVQLIDETANNAGKSREQQAGPDPLVMNLTQLRNDLFKLQVATI